MSDEPMAPEERDTKGWAHIRRIFNSFDREQEEWVPIDELATIVRLCGMVPTEVEVEEIRRIGDPEGTQQVSWENFQVCMEHCLNNFKSEKHLAEALQMFIPNEGKSITKTTLRYALQNYGDRMTDAEINQFFEDCPQEFDPDGVTQISDLVQRLAEFVQKAN